LSHSASPNSPSRGVPLDGAAVYIGGFEFCKEASFWLMDR
jgi:hypothetical protein